MENKLIIDKKEFVLVSESLANSIPMIKDVPSTKSSSVVWIIRNNILFVQHADLSGESSNRVNDFNFCTRSELIHASWFNGVMIAQTGEITWYREGKYPMYETELILKIEKGIITNHDVIFNECPF